MPSDTMFSRTKKIAIFWVFSRTQLDVFRKSCNKCANMPKHEVYGHPSHFMNKQKGNIYGDYMGGSMAMGVPPNEWFLLGKIKIHL